MRIEETETRIYQFADNGKWLTKAEDEDQRDFAESVMLPKGAALWDEWTNIQKLEWEKDHGILPIEETNTIE